MENVVETVVEPVTTLATVTDTDTDVTDTDTDVTDTDTDEETPAELADRVAARAILVSVAVSRFGLRRKVSSERLSVDDERVGVTISAEVVRATKRLLSCAEYDAIVKLDSAFYSRMMSRVLSGAYRKGVYHLPLSLLEWFEQVWAEYETERSALVEAFVEAYPQRIGEAAEALGVLFDGTQYPSAEDVRARFSIVRAYQQVGVPGALADINLGLFEAERARLQAQMAEAALEIRQGLRAGLLQLVDHLRERLEPGEDGKPKRLHASTVEALQDWLSLFESRDITGDRDLSETVEVLRDLMEDVDRDALKSDGAFRGALTRALDASAELVGSLVETGGGRRFDFSEE